MLTLKESTNYLRQCLYWKKLYNLEFWFFQRTDFGGILKTTVMKLYIYVKTFVILHKSAFKKNEPQEN